MFKRLYLSCDCLKIEDYLKLNFCVVIDYTNIQISNFQINIFENTKNFAKPFQPVSKGLDPKFWAMKYRALKSRDTSPLTRSSAYVDPVAYY